MGLTAIDIDLDLGLARGWLLRREVVETLHQQQTSGAIGQPSLTVGIDLTVVVGLVGLIPRQSVRGLEIHQSGRPDTIHRGIEEDETALVLHACHLPGSHTAGLVALVGDGVGDHDGSVVLVGSEGLAHPALQAFRHLTGHAQRRTILLDGVGVLVELLHGRPVPLFLRTGPEGAAEGLRPTELREHLAIVVLQ